MKSIIIYESTHHGNTKKLVDAIAKKYNVETASVENAGSIDLSGYGRIGLAAGIAFGKFYKRMEEFAAKIPSGKRAFLLYTCGNPSGGYVKSITRTLESNGAKGMIPMARSNLLVVLPKGIRPEKRLLVR